MPPSFGRQLWGLPTRVKYLSPQGVLLPLVYGTTASPLWLELRGLSAWQETPSCTVYRLTCQRLLPWLQVTFAMVPDAAWPGSDQRPWGTSPAAGPVGCLGRPSAPDPSGVDSFLSLGRPTFARVCGVLGHFAPVHRCARLVRCFACAMSWATWLLLNSVPARCVVLLVQCAGPRGSCSPVCPLGALLCLCGVLGHLALIHRCTHSVRCFACAVSWATWLLFTGVPARCVAYVCRVLGHVAPVHRCARSECCFACAVSWATWLLSTDVPARCVACVCGVLGHLAPVHRCARLVRCFACAVSWATRLLFTGVPALRVVLRVQCPGPLGSCSPVCPLGALLCLCSLLGLLAPVHDCARSVRCFACAVSWATWLLFTGVPARRVFFHVRCPGPLGSCSPLCPLGVLFCLCGVLGQLAPAHRCARSVRCLCVWCPWRTGFCSPLCPLGALFCFCRVQGHSAPVHESACSACCVACVVSWATWLLFTDVPARHVVLHVRCPGPLGSCSPVCPLCVLYSVCGVLGHLAPVHRCARSVRCFACAVSWATCFLFTGVPARCVPCMCGVLGHLAPVHPRACSVCCFACAVSRATWLLLTGVPARCVALCVPCPGPRGS